MLYHHISIIVDLFKYTPLELFLNNFIVLFDKISFVFMRLIIDSKLPRASVRLSGNSDIFFHGHVILYLPFLYRNCLVVCKPRCHKILLSKRVCLKISFFPRVGRKTLRN